MMSRFVSRLICLIAVFFAVGCGVEEDSGRVDSYVIEASDYDQSCQEDSDCELIYQGDYCECLSCPNAAINSEATDAFEADQKTAVRKCNPPNTRCGPLGADHSTRGAAICQPTYAACVQGVCTQVDGA